MSSTSPGLCEALLQKSALNTVLKRDRMGKNKGVGYFKLYNPSIYFLLLI